MKCPRCGGFLRWVLACPPVIGLSCFSCGNYLDERVMLNRGQSWADFWRKETDREFRLELKNETRAQRIVREFTESAIMFNL